MDVGGRKIMFDCGPATTYKMAQTGLHQLEVLHIPANHIGDLAPLMQLPQLAVVEVWNNPLERTAITEQIPALEAQGIRVYW